MNDVIDFFRQWSAEPIFSTVLRIIALVLVLLPLLFLTARLVRRSIERRMSPQAGMVVGKGIGYAGFALVTVAVFHELGFRIGALLGAAGVVGVAVGFAAQTSLSNIISGIFLISEKPFSVGDLIRVGDEVGEVMSIDLLSVKVRARDNRYIRIPNENLIKSQLINLTRFPIRRIDLAVGVAYKEDPGRVTELLQDIARREPLCLDEPEPLVVFQSFGDSALEFLFGVWCLRTDYLSVKTSIMSAVKYRFDTEDIEIPFPHRSIYTGSVTHALPIKIVSDDAPINDSVPENQND